MRSVSRMLVCFRLKVRSKVGSKRSVLPPPPTPITEDERTVDVAREEQDQEATDRTTMKRKNRNDENEAVNTSDAFARARFFPSAS